MPLTEVRWTHNRQQRVATVEAFLAEAEQDPTFPIPYAVAKSMLEEDAERPDEGLSVTTLLGGCVRCRVLEKYIPFSVDIMDLFYRWKGSMFHLVLENNVPAGETLAEVRFFKTLKLPDGSEALIHGKPDLIRGPWSSATLVDAKTTKQVPLYDNMWPNHEEQLNVYRWLVNHCNHILTDEHSTAPLPVDPHDIRFSQLVIWYIDNDRIKVIPARKGHKVATKSGGYKTVKENHIWSDEEVEAMVMSRYWTLHAAFKQYETTGTLPPYPPDFDYIGGWEHRFSPVARQCVEAYIHEQKGVR